MASISPELLNRLRNVLLECEQLYSNDTLNSVVASYAPLKPWRFSFPQANSIPGRVDAVIGYLVDKYRSDTQENALVLFVKLLSEKIDEADARHQQLVDLASNLEGTVGSDIKVNNNKAVDIGIIIPLEEEFEEFYMQTKKYYKQSPIQDKETGNYYYKFEYPTTDSQYQYTCVATFIGGMGLQKAALATERIISKWNPKTLVMLGIAAALDDDAKLGDVILATQVDNFLEEGKQGNKFEWKGEVYRCNNKLKNFAQNFKFVHSQFFDSWKQQGAEQIAAFPKQEIIKQLISQGLIGEQPNLICGDVASGPIVGAAKSFKDWLKTRNRKYMALEMEAAGLMAAVYEKANPNTTLVLRGISDKGDEKKKDLDNINSGFFRRYAMRNATQLFLYFMETKAFQF